MMISRNLLALTCLITICWASPFLGSGSSSSSADPATGYYKECTSDNECGQNECCSLEPNRYSVPSCKPLRSEGEVCRPGKYITLNSTLSYPGGRTIKLNDVHYVVCPCAHGLTCPRSSESSCSRAISTGSGFNQLSEFDSTITKN